jgi:ABC-type molybdate transport system permease subunit
MPDLTPLWLTLNLAFVTTVILLCLGTPIAWWLATTHSRAKVPVEALTALPLVLPPTVLGFYLLILLSPEAPIGRFWVSITGDSLTFSFSGLVIASVIYSLPFMVQPLASAFDGVGRGPLEAAASLRASPLDAFFSVVVPQSARGWTDQGDLHRHLRAGGEPSLRRRAPALSGAGPVFPGRTPDHLQPERPPPCRLSCASISVCPWTNST